MHTIETRPRTAPRTAKHAVRTTIYVDCIDATHRVLLAYWLTEAGYAVRGGPPPAPRAVLEDRGSRRILLTDRFGPGRSGDATILQMKAQQPGLRVVVIGGGGDTEPAQLSLARAAGADATLPAALDCEATMRLLQRLA